MNSPARDKIDQLQQEMLQHRCDMPEPEHFFAPGLYGRKFSMPEDMTVVGKIHKHSHFLMVLKGEAVIVTADSKQVVKAGDVFVGQPGVKRAVYAVVDTIFMNVHHNPTNTQDLDQIESDLIEDEGFKVEYHKAIERCNQ